jgi:hypothetical protein
VTRTGPGKPAGPEITAGRLDNACAFLAGAQAAVALAEPGANANPILVQVVSAAVAYGDALTARFGSRINQRDHAALPRALRATLGNRLPKAQERRLARILERKDEAQYGSRRGSLAEARSLLAELETFGAWVEEIMAGG